MMVLQKFTNFLALGTLITTIQTSQGMNPGSMDGISGIPSSRNIGARRGKPLSTFHKEPTRPPTPVDRQYPTVQSNKIEVLGIPEEEDDEARYEQSTALVKRKFEGNSTEKKARKIHFSDTPLVRSYTPHEQKKDDEYTAGHRVPDNAIISFGPIAEIDESSD